MVTAETEGSRAAQQLEHSRCHKADAMQATEVQLSASQQEQQDGADLNVCSRLLGGVASASVTACIAQGC